MPSWYECKPLFIQRFLLIGVPIFNWTCLPIFETAAAEERRTPLQLCSCVKRKNATISVDKPPLLYPVPRGPDPPLRLPPCHAAEGHAGKGAAVDVNEVPHVTSFTSLQVSCVFHTVSFNQFLRPRFRQNQDAKMEVTVTETAAAPILSWEAMMSLMVTPN